MTVKELIDQLQKFDGSKKVLFAQANGDINVWCEKAALQLDGDESVEIITIQDF